jgi:putative OPT family oligopeptide transporter
MMIQADYRAFLVFPFVIENICTGGNLKGMVNVVQKKFVLVLSSNEVERCSIKASATGTLPSDLVISPGGITTFDYEHGRLPYPEGTACAEVLVASDAGGSQARNVFMGIGFGALYKLLLDALHLFPSQIPFTLPFIKKAELGVKVSSALFGVGYILGIRIALVMVGGGLLSWLILIPAIAYWGAGRTVPLYPETTQLITDMAPSLIWTRYIRYIGAGAVATGGIVTLIKSIPTIIESFKIGARCQQNR